MQNGRENQSGGNPRFSPGSRSAAVQGDSDLADKISVLLAEEGQSGFSDLMERPEWKLAVREASSKSFSRSELLPRFLLYVCELTITGRTEEITEQRIGTRVFLRPEGYNPGEDNIV